MPDPYTFTADWFTFHVPHWQDCLAPFVGKPGVRYLEVGVFEGRSLFWILDHVLTGVGARATAVDAFFEGQPYTDVFRDNLERSGHADKVEVLAGDSHAHLKGLAGRRFEVIYVDGGHGPRTLYFDLAFAWDLLEQGGLLILDDYRKGLSRLPRAARMKPIVDAFAAAVMHESEVAHRGYQLILRRVAPVHTRAAERVPAEHREICTRFGDWYYFWEASTVVRADGSDYFPFRQSPAKVLFEQLLARGRLKRTLGRAVTLWFTLSR